LEIELRALHMPGKQAQIAHFYEKKNPVFSKIENE
jgi:hypothetical protein